MKQYEADEQKKLFRWADFMKTEYPELDMMFHIPNGGSRNTDCLSSLNLARTRQQQSKTNGLQN